MASAPSSLTSNVSNLAVISAPPTAEALLPKSYGSNITATTQEAPSQSLQYPRSHLCELWQQACHATRVYLGNWTFLRERLPSRSEKTTEETLQTSEQTDQDIEEQVAPKGLPSNGSNAALSTLSPSSSQSPAKATDIPDLPVAAEERSKGIGQGPNSQPARGSCMAIVIGLVVGVMWF